MRVMKTLTALALVLVVSGATSAQHAHHGSRSPSAGALKNLSEDDIAELRRGGGWGLAKAAELNGMPGPAHLLELKDQIPLSAGQVEAIEAIFQRMRKEAIAEGERFVARELALEHAFRDRTITDESLRQMLAEIEESRTALRYTHLAAHLSTPALVTKEQIARYNALRGYGSDPCANAPAGHDPAMWRKHNGCN